MRQPSAIVTLLTDFGLADYYVAAVKGVVLSEAPGVTLVDVSHEVPPGAIATASFLLAAAAPSFPPGTVHLAVVDPGVGSARRLLAVTAHGQRFLAPDNGLLTPWLAQGEVVAVERPDLVRPSPGQTFHGRDRFAPLAAFLARGGTVGELGARVSDAVRLAQPPPERRSGELLGRVVHVDRYGNLVTDLPSAWLVGSFVAEAGGRRIETLASHYAALPAGQPGLVPGSLATLEISVRGQSAAALLAVGVGAPVRVALGGS